MKVTNGYTHKEVEVHTLTSLDEVVGKSHIGVVVLERLRGEYVNKEVYRRVKVNGRPVRQGDGTYRLPIKYGLKTYFSIYFDDDKRLAEHQTVRAICEVIS